MDRVHKVGGGMLGGSNRQELVGLTLTGRWRAECCMPRLRS